MLLIFLFLNLNLQNKHFYQHYEDGIRLLQEQQYEAAAKELEAAIAIRADSSETAKTYGVQLKPYFPHHRLAEAYLGMDEQGRAHDALAQAFYHEEHESRDSTILARMAKIQADLFKAGPLIEKVVVNPEPSQPEPPSLKPIFLLILAERYSEAISEINRLQADHPDNEELPFLSDLCSTFIANKIRTEQEQDRDRNRIEKLHQDAVTRESEGKLEDALRHYIALKQLAPEREGVTEAIENLTAELERKGRTESDIQEQIAQAQDEIRELKKDIAKSQQEQERLKNQKRDALAALEQLTESQKQAEQSVIEVDWEVTLYPSKERVLNIRLTLSSNQPMQGAYLIIDAERIKNWQIRGRQQYTTATFNHLVTSTGKRVVLELVVIDATGKEQRFEYPYNFPKQRRWFDRTAQKFAIMLAAWIVVLLFALRQIRRRKAFRERFNPYIAGAPVLNERMFYGRSPILKQILNTLHNNSLMIYGERRIGKTSFLHRLYNTLPFVIDEEYEFIPVLIDLQGVREGDFFTTIDHEITSALELRKLEVDPQPEALDYRKFVSRLRKHIRLLKEHCDKKPKLVLLLDEVDIMNGFTEHTNMQLRSVFMKGFADHIVAVMAGIHINKQWKSEGSPWYNFFEQIELKPFNRQQGSELITKPVDGVYYYTKGAVDRIMEITDGKPYLIQKMCLNIVSHVLVENKRRVTDKDVDYVFNEIKKEFFGAN